MLFWLSKLSCPNAVDGVVNDGFIGDARSWADAGCICASCLLSLDVQSVVLQDLQEALVGAACADRRCA